MIHTSRLILRPFIQEDEATVVSFLMCPEFMVYSPTGVLEKEAAERRFQDLVSSYRLKGFGKLAVTRKSCGTLIGYCGVEVCKIDGVDRLELGFRLGIEYRGHGYATEAAKALLESTALANVIAFTEPSNNQSIKVLLKLGFKQTGSSSFEGMPIILFGRDVQQHKPV